MHGQRQGSDESDEDGQNDQQEDPDARKVVSSASGGNIDPETKLVIWSGIARIESQLGNGHGADLRGDSIDWIGRDRSPVTAVTQIPSSGFGGSKWRIGLVRYIKDKGRNKVIGGSLKVAQGTGRGDPRSYSDDGICIHGQMAVSGDILRQRLSAYTAEVGDIEESSCLRSRIGGVQNTDIAL